MIGESPPAGATFFYQANSQLFRAVRDSFVEAFGPDLPTGERFLNTYQARGFFLLDLCDEPVNQLKDNPQRLTLRDQGERTLAKKLAALPAEVSIVVLMKAIEANVRSAITRSGRSDLPVDLVLPFPGRPQHRETFVHGLASFLRARDWIPDRNATTATGSNVTLHEEIGVILRQHAGRWMTRTELADEVNSRGRYTKRDGSRVTPFQIYARARKYPHLFGRDGSRVRLLDE